jgi:vanillate/4-hydroxybenzoate decarboxylase subunit C
MAAVQGIRDFLVVLEKNGQLLRIAEEVSLEPDIGAAGRAISQLGETMPALNFEKIKGYKSAHIVTNIHGSWPNPWPRCLAPPSSPVSPQSWSHSKCGRGRAGHHRRLHSPSKKRSAP